MSAPVPAPGETLDRIREMAVGRDLAAEDPHLAGVAQAYLNARARSRRAVDEFTAAERAEDAARAALIAALVQT